MEQQDPDHLINAEHIPEEILDQSYAELYRNIGYWVEQSEGITNVPSPQKFDENIDPLTDNLSADENTD